MEKILSLDNFKSSEFKRTILKNSFRLRKYNSTFFDHQKTESPKYKKHKSIKRYFLIPKRVTNLINNETDKNNIKDQILSEKRKYSKKHFISNFLLKRKKNQEEENNNKNNSNIESKNNVNKINKSFIYNRNNEKLIYKKKYTKSLKLSNVNGKKDTHNGDENNNEHKTIKHVIRRKRNSNNILDLKKLHIVTQFEEKESNDSRELTDINLNSNSLNINKKPIILKRNSLFLNGLKNGKTKNLNTKHSFNSINTLDRSHSIIMNKKSNHLNGKQKNNNQIKNENNKIRLKNKYSLAWMIYSKRNENNNSGLISKKRTLDAINTLNISGNQVTNNTINNSKYSDNEKNESFIINFFEDIINLEDTISSKTYFNFFINDINKKYIMLYETAKFPNTNERFILCYKYFCCIIIILIFLSKDNDLYEKNYMKSKKLFSIYIYSSLLYTRYHLNKSKKIKIFLSKYNLSKKMTLSECVQNLLEINFNNKKEYTIISSIIVQLANIIIKESITNILSIINNSILYCFNSGLKLNTYTRLNSSKKNEFFFNFKDEKIEKQMEDDMEPPTVPFIRKKLKKKFCLVLDLDETIIHSVKLKSGYYFFVRPGAIEFLNEVSSFYEIIFFTSSYRPYADYILNKIDIKKNIISYRFYKSHVIFEKGRSIKKLSMLGRDLNKIIFVDNLKTNAKYNKKNLYLIPSWLGDINDDEIFKLKKILIEIGTNAKYNDDITKGLTGKF